MIIKFDIWAKTPETGKSHIANHIQLDDGDIEQLAIDWFGEHYVLDERFEYEARIDEIISI